MWFQFKICLIDADDAINVELVYTLCMLNCEGLVQFYPTYDARNKEVIILMFDDGRTILVYEKYKAVKEKLQPLIIYECG